MAPSSDCTSKVSANDVIGLVVLFPDCFVHHVVLGMLSKTGSREGAYMATIFVNTHCIHN